jgi:hypothetical protein
MSVHSQAPNSLAEAGVESAHVFQLHPPSSMAYTREPILNASSQNHKHIYEPILEWDSVRILNLNLAEDPRSGLVGSLINVRSLSASSEYEYIALSYVWGDQRDNATIRVNSHSLPIGANLASALIYLRRKDRPIRVWVDAICIN